MRDFTDDLKDLRRRLGEAEGYLKIPVARARLTELEFEISRPDLWDDQDEAKKINTEFSNVQSDIDTFDRLSQQLEDAEVLHEMARELDAACNAWRDRPGQHNHARPRGSGGPQPKQPQKQPTPSTGTPPARAASENQDASAQSFRTGADTQDGTKARSGLDDKPGDPKKRHG